VGLGAVAVALIKRVMHRRVCVPLAGTVFVVLLCAVGLEGKAQAQSSEPTVTNVNPNTGPTSGGTSVTITGTNFSGATAVSFGSNAAASFTVNSATQITATSPAGVGTVDVTVTTAGGTSATSTADQFTYVPAPAPAPTVTNINPNTGPSSGGSSVTISGTNFSGATAVRFGSNAAGSFTVDSATQITATSPTGVGTVDVTVTTAGGTSAISSGDRFTYGPVGTTTGPVGTTTTLSSSQNPSSFGQPVTFAVKVTGLSPTGSVSLFDGGVQIGTGTLAAGIASFTISSLAVGSHSLTARYSGDSNNAASTSAALIQTVNVPTDSIKLRAMQVSVTPMIAQISGQAIVGAIDYAIDAGFSENPQALTPNGAGFTFQTALGQPAAAPTGIGGNRTEGRVRVSAGAGTQRAVQVTAGSLANGLQGGNGAPPGTRLIDMPVIPLPPGSGMPPIGETQFSSDELVFQFASSTTPQQIGSIVQRFGLAVVAQETIGMLGRTVYTFRIANGQSVREVIRRVEAAGLPVAVQPKYTYRLAQDRNNPNSDLGDPAQYIVNKFQFAEVHQITKGDKAVVAVIDSAIDSPTQSRRHGQRPIRRRLRY
jgi:Bacterial Ig-like domain (group 3)/IPT/TIG domain